MEIWRFFTGHTGACVGGGDRMAERGITDLTDLNRERERERERERKKEREKERKLNRKFYETVMPQQIGSMFSAG